MFERHCPCGSLALLLTLTLCSVGDPASCAHVHPIILDQAKGGPYRWPNAKVRRQSSLACPTGGASLCTGSSHIYECSRQLDFSAVISNDREVQRRRVREVVVVNVQEIDEL